MALEASVQRVRIYLSQSDQWQGGPLYLAILERLRSAGATGATALTGLAGFGPGQRGRLAMLNESGYDLPVIIEWLDRPERVARILPLLDDLCGEAMVTSEPVPVYRATLRARGPFSADRSVGDLMQTESPTVTSATPLLEALRHFVTDKLAVLPVVDATGLLVGTLTSQEVAWRSPLRMPIWMLTKLTSAEREPLVQLLNGLTVGGIMTTEPRYVVETITIPQALTTMIEWGLRQVPVVDRHRRLVGLLGEDDILREAVMQAENSADEPAVREAEPPPPVSLVMQTVFHAVTITQPLNRVLAQLLATPLQPLFVLDPERRLVGLLTLASVLKGLAGEERTKLLTALQQPEPPEAASLPGRDRPLAELLEPPPPSLVPDTNLIDAAHRLIELQATQLPVVNGEQTLLGIIAPGGLVRALLQQSE
ncbi:DUF190 domain-containing protein [Candidatus Chloroploca asiatica]|uniref:CBS domain-containing protein n=1 Tax=Candidatus Chloroploca asiatica TaxID=1506545 RepID=A0A2H3KQ38_9CHLR|nr:DUF190 domain-containing protein [Candidatus Chloroploca asiatica]PDW00451.1 hypothetical protein A9Q02_09670 [Candidatus Chloroploca asiatica]